ncbi:L-type lectin-domain containing receptor kinase VIII.2-like [Tasmannia lanceolata]|uniref:L-type lectin-domain containing receptor kinase VIII.2-like n=1 Tax=Tasmannia lanceolata TaxID=3420 RepID=UPI004064B021
MAIFSLSRYSFSFIFLVFYFLIPLTAKHISSFSFTKFEKNPNFDSKLALFGDAEISGQDSSVKITRPSSSSSGRIMYRNPIKIFDSNPRKLVSFSTYFSFSISPGNGDGLAFIILPGNFHSELLKGRSFGLSPGLGFFAVEFDTLMDVKFEDPNGNHVGIDIGSFVSAKTRDVSTVNLMLNSGEKLHSWIDYNANLKALEVRLSKSGVVRPFDPLVSYRIDLSKLLKDEVFVGISSSSTNSTHTSNLYSWSFLLKDYLNVMHSEPLDPRAFLEHKKPQSGHWRSDAFLRILGAILFGSGCGAMVAVLVLFIWSVFVDRRPLVPTECPVHPVDFGYEKIIAIGEKGTQVGKK